MQHVHVPIARAFEQVLRLRIRVGPIYIVIGRNEMPGSSNEPELLLRCAAQQVRMLEGELMERLHCLAFGNHYGTISKHDSNA